MLNILVPILISFLMDVNQLNNKSKNKYLIQLHDQALQWLMRIGPKYPQVGFTNLNK